MKNNLRYTKIMKPKISKWLMLCLFVLNVVMTQAQKQDHIWLYGLERYDIVIPERAADTTRGACNLDFNFDPPKLYYDPKRFLDF
ncbi:MAG: hypothetical protein IPJ39_13715 [Saprospiraceae bacterium]|nr:hypothetical protein [Saprospiraceae bacterium]